MTPPREAFTGGEDVSGTIPANSVDLAPYLFASYEWALSGGSTISVRGDWSHREDVWGQNGANNRAGLNLNGDGFMYLRPALDKIGLQLGWTSADQKIRVSLWGRNLDNDPDYINYGPPFGYVYLNGPSVGGSPQVRARAVGSTGRRSFGGTIRYDFF